MKAFVSDYEMKTAVDLNEALKWLSQDKSLKLFAGGTDLMVQFEAGKLPTGKYLNILNLKDLSGISVAQDEVRIGATTTYSEIANHSVIQSEFPILVAAAKLTGAPAIQNRGTIGGNIANASPAADSPPALLVYDTTLEIVNSKKTRKLDYSKFHVAYKKMDLQAGEILKSVILKRNTKSLQIYYKKVGTRMAQSISKVCLAASWNVESKELKVGLGSVAATPIGFTFNKETKQNVIKKVLNGITPQSDIRSTEDFRRDVVINLLNDMFEKVSYVS